MKNLNLKEMVDNYLDIDANIRIIKRIFSSINFGFAGTVENFVKEDYTGLKNWSVTGIYATSDAEIELIVEEVI